MPARHLHRVAKEKSYSHIFNRGVEDRIIFGDSQDYEVFLGFLQDYLTLPNSENSKKVFTVKGKTFRGTPHLPKNYFDKVELIAYSLGPNNFHLLLHQKSRGVLENFIRSLCTRYSMYFNKKYARSGSLFAGPYKSIEVKDASRLLLLTRSLHASSEGYSSYPEYLGQRVTPWVKPDVVLSYFDKAENTTFKGIEGYKNFVEKYEPSEEEQELLNLEGRNLSKDVASVPETGPVETEQGPVARAPEFAVIFAVFLLLAGLGLRNINTTRAKNLTVSSKPAVLSESTETTPEPTATPTPKRMVIVKITDGAEAVNIRQNPTVNSEKIGEAHAGETFEFVAINSGWFEIKLPDGRTGFILSTYAQNTNLF